VNALIIYQVPVTTRAGLPLGIAAAVAGFRGLAQLYVADEASSNGSNGHRRLFRKGR